jgi:hypothetical protein
VKKRNSAKPKKRPVRRQKPSAETKQLATSMTEWAHELVAASKAIKRREN